MKSFIWSLLNKSFPKWGSSAALPSSLCSCYLRAIPGSYHNLWYLLCLGSQLLERGLFTARGEASLCCSCCIFAPSSLLFALQFCGAQPGSSLLSTMSCPWYYGGGAVPQLARLASWFCLLGELPLHHCPWSLHTLSGRFFLGKNLYGNIWSGCCWAFPDPLLPGFRVQAIVGIGTGFWKLHLRICWSYIFFKQLGESLVCLFLGISMCE